MYYYLIYKHNNFFFIWENFSNFGKNIYKIILDRPREIGGDGLNWLFGIAGTPMRPAEPPDEDPAAGWRFKRRLLLKFGADDLFCCLLLVMRMFSSSVVSSAFLWNDPLRLAFNRLFDECAPKLIEEEGIRTVVVVDTPSSTTTSSLLAGCRRKNLKK